MTIVHFHNLVRPEKDRAICRLALEYYEAGRRVIVLAESDHQANTLDRLLWSFQQSSFIPHRIWQDGSAPELDKVLITTQHKQPEGFDVLILACPGPLTFLRGFAEVVDFAEKYAPDSLVASRARYKECQGAGLTVKFVQKELDLSSEP